MAVTQSNHLTNKTMDWALNLNHGEGGLYRLSGGMLHESLHSTGQFEQASKVA